MLTVPTEGDDDAQLTLVVRFSVDPPWKFPIALNLVATPIGTVVLVGVTEIEVNGELVTTTFWVTVSLLLPS